MHKSIDLSLDRVLAEQGINVLFILATGVIREEAAALSLTAWQDAQASINPKTAIDHAHLLGYRKLHKQCQVDDESLIPAPESLIKIYLEQGSLRSFGPIIDLYNTVSLNHLISAGAHDADQLGNSVELTMNRGGEKFRPLGQKKKLPLPGNEYSYKTDMGRPICRLECKQANETKLRENTSKWLFILQGNAEITSAALQNASRDLINKLEALTVDCRWDSALLGAETLNAQLKITI